MYDELEAFQGCTPEAVSTPITAFDETAYAALLVKYKPRPIHTEDENRRAIELLTHLDENGDALTPEQEMVAELLTTLIEQFEEQHYT